MKSAEDFGEYLQKLIDRHREDLSILLKDYRVYEEPTPILLMEMMKAHPEFIGHMANLPEDRADGGFLDTLTKGYNLISRGKEAVNVLKGENSTAPVKEAPDDEDDEKPKWSAKKIIAIGASIVIALIILTVIVKRIRKK